VTIVYYPYKSIRKSPRHCAVIGIVGVEWLVAFTLMDSYIRNGSQIN